MGEGRCSEGEGVLHHQVPRPSAHPSTTHPFVDEVLFFVDSHTLSSSSGVECGDGEAGVDEY